MKAMWKPKVKNEAAMNEAGGPETSHKYLLLPPWLNPKETSHLEFFRTNTL